MTNPSAQLNTFMFSNIAPHYQDHNTGEISITFVQRDSQVNNISQEPGSSWCSQVFEDVIKKYYR